MYPLPLPPPRKTNGIPKWHVTSIKRGPFRPKTWSISSWPWCIINNSTGRLLFEISIPAGTWRQTDVAPTSIWCHFVASTSMRRHCPLGCLSCPSPCRDRVLILMKLKVVNSTDTPLDFVTWLPSDECLHRRLPVENRIGLVRLTTDREDSTESQKQNLYWNCR